MKAALVVYKSEAWEPFKFCPIQNHAILIDPHDEGWDGDNVVIAYRFRNRFRCTLKKKLRSFPVGMTGNVVGNFPAKVPAGRYKVIGPIAVSTKFAKRAIRLAQARSSRKSLALEFATLLSQ